MQDKVKALKRKLYKNNSILREYNAKMERFGEIPVEATKFFIRQGNFLSGRSYKLRCECSFLDNTKTYAICFEEECKLNKIVEELEESLKVDKQ